MTLPRRAPALVLLCLLLSAGSAGGELQLWSWQDENGVTRYTPDPDRIPGSRRSTMQRVEPGSWQQPAPPERSSVPALSPGGAVAAPAMGSSTTYQQASPQGTAPVDEPDPFNEPSQARSVESSVVEEEPEGTSKAEPPPVASPAPPTPAQQSRIQELEAMIASDQETLKALISDENAEGTDTSQEIEEIARRLPTLQRELRELRGLPPRKRRK